MGKLNKIYITIVFLIITIVYMLNYAMYQKHLINYVTESTASLHFKDVPRIYSAIKEFDLKSIFYYSDYPPLYRISAALILVIFGKNWILMNLINNTFYLLMLLAFLYLLGKKLKDDLTGILMMILVSLYPLTYGSYQMFLMDFPLMGLITMSLYFFYRSENFKNRFWSILFGIACGWGMMTKLQFGAFIAGPIIYGIFVYVKEIKTGKYYSLINSGLFTIITVTIMLPYYINANIFQDIKNCTCYEVSGFPWYSFENIKYFTTGLWEYQLTPPFFLILLFGLYYFLKEADINIKVIVITWIVIPNIILLLMPHSKSARYFLTQLPAFAIISAFGLRNIASKFFGKTIILLIIILGIAQYYDFTYGIGLNLKNIRIAKINYFTAFGDLPTDVNTLQMKEYVVYLGEMQKTLARFTGILDKNNSKANYVMVNIKSFDGFDMDESLSGYLWFNSNKIKGKYEYLTMNFNFDNIYDNLDTIDFIIYAAKDIELKNPDYFNASYNNFMENRRSKFTSNQDNISKNDVIMKKHKWDEVMKRFTRSCIICNAKQDGKPYNIYLYLNNKLAISDKDLQDICGGK
jgi:hypothetical protein